jgi:hypothetical protein
VPIFADKATTPATDLQVTKGGGSHLLNGVLMTFM